MNGSFTVPDDGLRGPQGPLTTCSNCKHWKAHDTREAAFVQIGGPSGDCEAKDPRFGPYHDHERGFGEADYIITRADFGCVAFEAAD